MCVFLGIMMICMCIILMFDDDVVWLVEDVVYCECCLMKQVINDVLCRVLVLLVKWQEQYWLELYELVVCFGLDLVGFNKLVDELEDEVLLDVMCWVW